MNEDDLDQDLEDYLNNVIINNFGLEWIDFLNEMKKKYEKSQNN